MGEEEEKEKKRNTIIIIISRQERRLRTQNNFVEKVRQKKYTSQSRVPSHGTQV